jgi:hypothetical protein
VCWCGWGLRRNPVKRKLNVLEEWLKGVVETFLDFDEESVVFRAGFAVVALS